MFLLQRIIYISVLLLLPRIITHYLCSLLEPRHIKSLDLVLSGGQLVGELLNLVQVGRLVILRFLQAGLQLLHSFLIMDSLLDGVLNILVRTDQTHDFRKQISNLMTGTNVTTSINDSVSYYLVKLSLLIYLKHINL